MTNVKILHIYKKRKNNKKKKTYFMLTSYFKDCIALFIFLYIKDAKFFTFKVKTEYTY